MPTPSTGRAQPCRRMLKINNKKAASDTRISNCNAGNRAWTSV